MVGLQGHSGELIFRYVGLAGPTGESVLEEFLRFGVVAALILARPAGPLGSVLEVYFWMAFGNAEVVSPLWAPR